MNSYICVGYDKYMKPFWLYIVAKNWKKARWIANDKGMQSVVHICTKSKCIYNQY
ncbi:MAG: hypothetical protein ACFFDN_02750 [Candidatus Hodarchaeota archaeon]